MSQRTPVIFVVTLAFLTWASGHSANAAAPDRNTIVFVCAHGSVESQMAAAHFNRIARERGLGYVAVSRGIEVDASIPTWIRDGLNADGLAPVDNVPRPLTAAEAVAATKVVAFDAVPDDRRGEAEISHWPGVPPAMKNDVAARDVIVSRIDDLIPALARLPQETVRGMVTAVDERNDRLTVRLASGHTADFKVQDGLIFNAVRYGDQVELTVMNLDGARTIVGLTKE